MAPTTRPARWQGWPDQPALRHGWPAVRPKLEPMCYNSFNESEGAVAGYKVQIDDNFHFMNEDYRVTSGVFSTPDEAITACKLIVDECLKPMLQPGMTATALYEQYKGFGDDPFIVCRSIQPTHRWPSQLGHTPKNDAKCWARSRRSNFRLNGRM